MSELTWGAVVLAVLAFFWAEIRKWLPSISRRIVVSAVQALPIEQRERMEEELVAEVASLPGKLSPLLFACSVWWGYWNGAVCRSADLYAARALHRMADALIGGSLLFICAPVMVGFSCTCLLTLGHSGVIHRRFVGKGGRKFWLTYFYGYDPRTGKLSAFGRIAHRAALGGLPMLVNVVRGDMSLIGPPAVPYCHPNAGLDLHVRPGMFWLAGPEGWSSGFGESMLPTMRIYFQAMYVWIKADFCDAIRKSDGR